MNSAADGTTANPYFHNAINAHQIHQPMTVVGGNNSVSAAAAATAAAAYTQLCHQQPNMVANRNAAVYAGQQFFIDNGMPTITYSTPTSKIFKIFIDY